MTNWATRVPGPYTECIPQIQNALSELETTATLPGWLSGYDVQKFGAVGDGVTNDRDALNTLVNTTLPNGGEVYFTRPGDYLINSAMTFPANVRLWFVSGARLKPANGVTVTVLSAIHDTPYQIFTNILSSQGVISFAGNLKLDLVRAAWYGVVGDDTTDCTSTLQRITDQLSTDNLGIILVLPSGIILIAGPLQDPGLSNAQWVLPKRAIAGGQFSLTIIGERPPAMLTGVSGDNGTVLRSSLTSGSGAMIGCKTIETFGSSQLNLWFQNLTFQMPQNPTNTCLDLRSLKRFFMRRFKIYATNWQNTEPTTSSSWGLRTPNVNVISDSGLEDGVVSGFYNNIEANELAYLNNVQEGPAIWGWTFPHNIHPTTTHRIGSFFSRHTVRVTGVATVTIEILHIERAAEAGKWYSADQHIDDFSETTAGDAHGEIGYLISDSNASPPGPVVNAFIVATVSGTNAPHIRIHNLFDSKSLDDNYTDPTGSSFLNKPAVLELNPKRATSAETDMGMLILGAQQSGTANTVGIITFLNTALTALNKRIAQIAAGTDGETNSGLININTWNGGVAALRVSITKSDTRIFNTLDLRDSHGALILHRLTTTDRDALTGVTDGMIIYNTSTSKFQGRAAGAWVDLH